MKKVFAALLCVSLVTMVAMSAFAASFSGSGLSKGSASISGTTSKTSSTGSAATANVSSLTRNSTWQLRVLKSDGVNASEYARYTTTGDTNDMASLTDGYGQALLRYDYSYKLKATHSSASGVNTASTSGTWYP